MATRDKRRFGQITKLPSGRFRARYADPEGRRTPMGEPVRHNGPTTFDTREDAEAWLAAERRLITSGSWEPPAVRIARRRAVLTFGEYSGRWLEQRTLKPRTRAHYRSLIDHHLSPTFGSSHLPAITSEAVKNWHSLMGSSRPTLRAHAYGLLRTILADAERDDLLARNPCHIRGAGNVKRVHKIKPATLQELELLVAAMPTERQVMTLLAAWCGLRFGELVELRRKDIALGAEDDHPSTIHVRRAVTRVGGDAIVSTPKSDAGIRDVAIPPHLVPALRHHLRIYTAPGRDALLFAGRDGTHLAPSTLYGRETLRDNRGSVVRSGHGFYEARFIAGRRDLRWHDLRHTGAVLAAATGATLAELMSRLGHSTPGAALRYQHAADGRDAEIARRLSAMAGGA